MTKGVDIYDRVGYEPGAMVIEEGNQDSQAFLIQSGDVEIFRMHEGKERELAILGPGEIIGEMALICHGVRKASVRAKTQCSLIRISKPEFEERLEKCDNAVQAVFKMLVKRISQLNDMVSMEAPDADPVLEYIENIQNHIEKNPDQVDLSTISADLAHLAALIKINMKL